MVARGIGIYSLLFAVNLILFAALCHFAVASIDPEIPWRKKGLGLALEEAKAAKKPLLVYWGASWCPPCNALKARAFHDPKFIEATKPFIPVYLDGDSDDAQIWGEKLKVSGYPSLLVLNEDGKEVQRLVTDDPLVSLIAEINRTLADLGPWQELLDKATSAKATTALPLADWKRIADHEWLYDQTWKGKEKELAARMETLIKLFPSSLEPERTNLEIQAMQARAETVSEKEPLPISEQDQWRTELKRILVDPVLFKALATRMCFYSDTLVKTIFPGDTKDLRRDAFIETYLSAVRHYKKDKGLTYENQLDSLYAFAALTQGSNQNKFYPPLSKEDASLIKKEIDADLKGAKSQERVLYVLGMLPEVYGALGLGREAEKILVDKLNEVHSKSDLMITIAEFEDKQNHPAESLKWKERAYRESSPGASRTQWGLGYVNELIKRETERT